MRDQLRIGSATTWVVAWLLAIAAPFLHLLWSGDLMWWIGMVFLIPLVGLTAWRADAKGYTDPYNGPGDGGPWGPPA